MESKLSLKEFQSDAERFFKGDIEQLIEHYKNSKDHVFSQGGDSISTIYQRSTLLDNSLIHFNKDIFSPYKATFIMPIADIRDEAWNNYDHSIRLNEASIIWALGLGFIITSLCELVLALLLKTMKTLDSALVSKKKSKRPQRQHKNSPPTI